MEGRRGWNGKQREGCCTNAFSSCSTLGLLFRCAYRRKMGGPFELSRGAWLELHTSAQTWSIKPGAGGSLSSWQFMYHGCADDKKTSPSFLPGTLLSHLKWPTVEMDEDVKKRTLEEKLSNIPVLLKRLCPSLRLDLKAHTQKKKKKSFYRGQK